MGLLEKIKELEREMERTQKNKATTPFRIDES